MTKILKLLTIDAGTTVTTAIDIARKKAANEDCTVKFKFNSVTILVNADSNRDTLLRDYNRAQEGHFGDFRLVGPYPRKQTQ